MRILQVTRQYFPSVGGIQSVVYHLSRELIARRHQVEVIALNRLFADDQDTLPQKETMGGIPVRRIPFVGPRQYAIAPRVLREVKAFDLVHVHSSDFFLDFLAWTKPLHHKPLVLTTHGLFFHTRWGRLFKHLYFRLVTRLDLLWVSKIICVSEHDYNLVRRIAPAQKLHLIPNGIDFTNLLACRSEDREPGLLLSVGRLAPNKRLDRLLRTFALLAEEQSDVHLVIIGPDLGLRASLEGLAHELKIANRVTFLGRVSDEILRQYLGRARLWLSASRYEAFGVSLLESMAAGCIPVVQSIPAFQQLIREGEDGFLTDFDRPSEAAGVIRQALSLDEADRQAMTRHGRTKAARYAWDRITAETLAVYEEAAGEV